MMVAFLIGWVPVIGTIAGLLVLIGFILVYSGRDYYGETFRRYVVLGSNLLGAAVVLIGVLLAAVIVLGFTGRLSPTGAAFLLVALFVPPAVLGLASVVFLVYGAADGRTRGLLWAGFGTGLAGGTVYAALFARGGVNLLLLVSGTSVTTGLILLTLVPAAIAAVPSLLFAWAYRRVRRQLLGPTSALPG